jgi:hypothetical protein
LTYAAQKIKFGKEPVTILELEMDLCPLVWSVGSCTASGSAGDECFNTAASCQLTDIYASQTKTTKTYRFSSFRLDGLQADGEMPTFPTIQNVSTAPTELNPSKGLGIRSTCSITLTDHPWTDIGIDPYLSNRTYTPDDQGTFWGKFMARNSYYEGRKMTVKTGYLADDGTYDANNFISRTFFIDTITGPSKDGKVVIKGKDVLKFADSNRKQLPSQSRAELPSDITDAATSFDITDPDDDVKDAYDANQKYIRIDDETMLMTNLTGSNPTYTATVTRATMPSTYEGTMTAEEHSAESTVQQCYHVDAQRIDIFVNYILDTIAGIDSSYLPTSDWDATIDFGFQSYLLSALLTEPIGINELLEEITEHNILLWWDERDQEVKMDTILNRVNDYGPFNDDDNLIAGSVGVARSDKERISHMRVAYGHRNPVLELDKLENFTTVKVSIDTDKESTDEYDESKISKVWSRFLPTTLGSVASEITNRTLNYYKVTKHIMTFSMDAKDDDAWTGDLIGVETRQRQTETGATESKSYRVLKVNEIIKTDGVMYKYTIQSTDQDGFRYGRITPNSMGTYSAETQANRDQYAFIGPNSGLFPDDGQLYRIL